MTENQKTLTRKEEIIMLSILNLGAEAYLVAIGTISFQTLKAVRADPVNSLRHE